MNQSRRPVLLALGALMVGAVVFYSATKVAKEGKAEVKLGPNSFVVGNAVSRAAGVRENGPLLFPDAGGRDKDIFVTHTGNDSSRGWLAFDARVAGQSRACPLRWLAEQTVFVDTCTGVLVPADGGTLKHYTAKVSVGGTLEIDLRVAP